MLEQFIKSKYIEELSKVSYICIVTNTPEERVQLDMLLLNINSGVKISKSQSYNYLYIPKYPPVNKNIKLLNAPHSSKISLHYNFYKLEDIMVDLESVEEC